jgi:cation:H+ antiporter
MIDWSAIGLVLLGLVVLTIGGEWLVRGASRLAAAFGVSSLVIGLTVVAFGTSAPELAVSLLAAVKGQADIAFGNVVGSNICNILLILGLSAAVSPLIVARKLLISEIPIMIGTAVALVLVSASGRIGRIEGILLVAGLLSYIGWSIVSERRANAARVDEPPPRAERHLARDGGLILFGLVGLTIGAHWLVEGATAIARSFGISELVIGLTIVAVGTSLPELATSVIATIRGEREIAIGNVVGSNIFNVLCVIGVSATVAPNGLDIAPAAFAFDLPVMLIASFACLPIFYTGHRIERWEGWLFLGYYAAYIVYLILASTHHDSLPLYDRVMLWFALPLSVVTFIVLTARSRDRVSRGA